MSYGWASANVPAGRYQLSFCCYLRHYISNQRRLRRDLNKCPAIANASTLGETWKGSKFNIINKSILDKNEFKKWMTNYQESNMDRNLRNQELIKAYKSNDLPIPKIEWHLKNTEVDLSLQTTSLRPELFADGFTIIPDIQIETLFDRMTKADAAMFRKRKLYNTSFTDMTISSVLDFWLKGGKLIPPTIMIYTKEYAKTLKLNIFESTELMPVDGKHRINVAYYFGVKSIPILVINPQIHLITQALNIKL